MTRGMQWDRRDAEAKIRQVLDAAKARGPQKVSDADGTFEVIFVPRKQSLEDLFSRPGTIPDDDSNS